MRSFATAAVRKMSDFSGKRVLVTGAGSGIGRGVAVRLSQLGAEVYALSKTQARLDALKAECPTVQTICQDVGDWEATKKAVESLPAMNGCVHSAGAGDQVNSNFLFE